jgi:hypothetical protein
MKTLIALSALVMLMMSSNKTNAQQKRRVEAGLYLTATDFQQKKLTYEIDRNDAKNKIKLNSLFGSSTGYILSKGEKHEFNKKKIYGYRSFDNKNYRFYNGEAYLIIDTSGFYMYYQYKSEENIKGKEPIKKDEYFFSKNADDDLKLLTIENLKNAFPANHHFHYDLDANFRSGSDLVAYDSFQKIYKIKYWYNQSAK